ncbi:MAG: hypothetical protein Q8P41_25035 [Pseudomonadota bacterium]|nr:hypothetical protein [Pseudomonadota bacterium]
MRDEGRELVDRLDRLLQAWTAAYDARDDAAVEHLSRTIEAITTSPEFLAALRRVEDN